MRCDGVEFSVHAMRRLRERELDPAVVERALARPDWTEPDPDIPLVRAFVTVTGSSRPLRVVIRMLDDGRCFVVTLFPDRRANRRGPR